MHFLLTSIFEIVCFQKWGLIFVDTHISDHFCFFLFYLLYSKVHFTDLFEGQHYLKNSIPIKNYLLGTSSTLAKICILLALCSKSEVTLEGIGILVG